MKRICIAVCLCLLSSVLLADEGERTEIMFRRDNQTQEKQAKQAERVLPIDPWVAPKQVGFERVGDDIVVRLPTSIMLFSGKTANIADAKVLGTPMVQTSHPNLVVVSSDGTEYSQNRSAVGKLDAFDDGDYINVFGRFALTSSDSTKYLTPDVWYKIDKNNGYTQVKYSIYGKVWKADPPVEIQRLYADLMVGRVDRNKVDYYWQGAGVSLVKEGEWEPWTNFRQDLSKNGVIFAGKLITAMMVNNARMGFATEPITFEGMSVEPGLDGYMSYLVADGQHVFRYTLVNHKANPYKLCSPLELRFTMSYLPMREYRKCGMRFFAGASTGPTEAARVGVDTVETWGYMGYPYADYGKKNADMLAFNRNLHKRGIKQSHFCVNWYGLADPTPRYPEPFSETAKHDQVFSYGRLWTWEGTDPNRPVMCLNSQGWFDNYYENAIHNITDFDGDGIRLDCCSPYLCKNTMHGCSKDYSCETLAYYTFGKKVDTFFKAMSKSTKREYVLAGATNFSPCVNAYLDLALSGEGDAGYPSPASRDAVFNAFISGRDLAKLAGGNSPTPLDDPKIYEMMIARCGTLMYAPDMTASEIAHWMKYSNPFKIFGANGSQVHHPYHCDYPEYVQVFSDKVFPIIYSRAGESLVVVCNESESGGDGELHLNAGRLGLPNHVMVFEPFSGTYRCANVTDGILRQSIDYPKPWDVSFYVVRSVPKTPEIIWHDARIYTLDQSYVEGTLSAKIEGIPEKTYSYADVYTAGMGCPTEVRGADLLSFNPADGMARIKVTHDESGANDIAMSFGKNRKDQKSQADRRMIDVDATNEVKSMVTMFRGMNYRERDKNELQARINSIRSNMDAVPEERRREMLSTLVDVERLVYVCEEVKQAGKQVLELEKKLNSIGCREQQWTILAPLANDANGDFGFASDELPNKLDMTATYKGYEDRSITGRNVVGYYLDFNVLAGRPLVGPTGLNAKNMTAFAISNVISPEDRDAVLRLSGIGSVKVWFNGHLLNPKGAELKASPEVVVLPIRLNAGVNTLMYKMETGLENWNVYTTLADPDGKDITDKLTFRPILNSEKSEYAHPFYVNVKERIGR